MTETDIAYMAGIIDSSETVFYDSAVSVINGEEAVLKILLHFFGGKISVNYEDHGKDGYDWVCNDDEYLEFKECIEPYLRIQKWQ